MRLPRRRRRPGDDESHKTTKLTSVELVVGGGEAGSVTVHIGAPDLGWASEPRERG